MLTNKEVGNTPERRPLQRQAPTLTEALRLQVRIWLTSDLNAPRQQRHTDRRIWQRLRKEHGFEGAGSTVRHFVSACRRSLGLKQQAFVPLCHLPSQQAEVDKRFIALRSHYLFTSEFCRPGIQGAHEKGGVEGGVGYFRRKHLVPVPTMDSYAALNSYFLDCCAADELQIRQGHSLSIAEDFAVEQCSLSVYFG